ncbi:MAG: hypothetical protein C6I01_01900 [Epsilonproteobacteria bacterium]|nr:hypothetical protein [Campylobacterota bacterium]
MRIKSKKIENLAPEWYGAFELPWEGGVKEIKEIRINTPEAGELRAISEFLEGGYIKQEVEFTAPFAPVKPNDIIRIYAPDFRVPSDLTKDLFIVKEVKHYIGAGYIKTKIKGVRYDEPT